jgi:MoxR-like ATPase
MTPMSDPTSQEDFARAIVAFQEDCARIVEQVRSVIVGHEEAVDEVMACLLGGGHGLLEGVPGLGKTLLVRTLAQALELSFSRVQFTPDLMPADITGTSLVVADEKGSKRFEFEPGPIFANLVLADEINRATPKTQSAVLEAMQEQTVTVARTTHPLPGPFLVLATQNPLEMEGTYPLPEAQLDRFMLKIHLDGPDVDELVEIMDRTTGAEPPWVAPVCQSDRILEMRRLVRQVAVASAIKEYVALLVLATHPHSGFAAPAAKKYVRYGASPRGAQAILLASKVRALRAGRANVSFADARAVARAALRHRLILSFEGQVDGVEPDSVVQEILDTIPQPETA